MRERSFVEMSEIAEREKSKNLSILKQLAPFLKPYRLQFWLASLFLVLATASLLGLGCCLRQLIDSGFATENMQALTSTVILMLGCVVLMAFASFGRTYYVSWLGERIMTDLRQKLYRHLLQLDVAYYEMIRPGELTARLTTDTTLIQILIGTSGALAIRNALMFVGGMALMLTTSAKLSLLTCLIVPVVLVPILIFGKRVKQLSTQTQEQLANLSGYLEETLSNIRACYAFNRELSDIHNFAKLSESNFYCAVTRMRMKSWLTFIVMILVFSGVCFVLWIGGYDVLTEGLTAGELSSFIFYAVMTAGSLASFSEIYADMQRAAGAFERLSDILQAKSSVLVLEAPRKLPAPSRGIVAFHNITFAYSNNPTVQVLKNLSLSIAPGEKLAIVGPSGSGKSTILSLLLRFFDPLSGSIYVDGVDTKEVRVEDLRERFGIVPQDPMIYSASLYDNILFGRPNASESEVWKAAEAANMVDFIQTLPQGIHTPLGTRGVRLSGGQKQRLAIARVFLRDAPILLLDEATSALDAESEFLVQESFKKLMSNRTTLVVAHRLATVLKADRIVVLNEGRIEAMGTHAELISEDGLYRRLATLQFTDSLDVKNIRQKGHANSGF
ncbi:ABC transporter transmembrane domain-containing protein [Candidatus Paracaedibacter symbiosus]|uniref:ABC transporter transmembrane domain-containing protein n=1 Tax=Candidatus Paracaedibacter symbiosus TaxID=244582 RepID=UPI00068C380A|nr:ABC transporter transmembrane domain-containing protein [Candidatus Paracaedibacter symbiosus]